MLTPQADDRGRMKLGSPSRHTAVADRSGDLLELLSELIDAHTDTVQLITGDEPTEREWLAHCDYLRALQRLGRETLAHHDQRIAPPPGLGIVAGVTGALTRSWTAARAVLRSPARVAHTLPLSPIVQLLQDVPVKSSHAPLPKSLITAAGVRS